MTRTELQKKLYSQHIRTDAYSLDGTTYDECYILDKEDSNWVVYYSERGLKTNKQKFITEDEACSYLYNKLKNDPTVKMK